MLGIGWFSIHDFIQFATLVYCYMFYIIPVDQSGKGCTGYYRRSKVTY